MKNNLLLFCILILYSMASFTQTPDWKWAKNNIGRGTDHSTSIATDANGNSYITGYFRSDSIIFGAFTLYNKSSITHYDLFIVKYDSAGTVLWAKAAGGFSDEQAMSIAADAAGNVYVTGMFASDSINFGSTTLLNAGPPFNDMFLVKFDSNGNVLWANSAGDAYFETPYSVATDGNGNVVVAGFFDSPSVTFGTTTLNNIGLGGDIFIVKYDTAGAVIWAKREGGTDSDVPNCITADSIGNIYMTGGYYSPSITFGTFTFNNVSAGNNNDLFIVKYDLNGIVVWAEGAGGVNDDAGFGLATGTNGTVFLTGSYSSSSITIGTALLTNSNSGASMFIVKFNSSGNVIWARQSFGSSAEAFSVGVDENDNAYVTGDFGSPAITFGAITQNSAISGIDLFLVKYDSAGTEQWVKGVGGNYATFGRSLDIDASGNIYITGDFNCTTLTFGSTMLTNTISGDYEIFIARLDTAIITGIESKVALGKEYHYPNPCSGLINISFTFSREEKVTLKILDVNGRLVASMADKTFKEGKNDLVWNIDELSEGIYFIQIQSGGKQQTEKLIVVK